MSVWGGFDTEMRPNGAAPGCRPGDTGWALGAIFPLRPSRCGALLPTGPPMTALRRAEHARDRLGALKDEQQRLVRERDRAIRELSQSGMSYEAIARAAGVSRARVGQIVTAEDRPAV